MEPARLDPRNLGRGKGLGALRPGDRTARLAGPGISGVAGERIVAETHVGARRVGRGERVGGGHASAAMNIAALTSIYFTAPLRRASSSHFPPSVHDSPKNISYWC